MRMKRVYFILQNKIASSKHVYIETCLQSCVSTVGLGGSILFRQLLPFPVYASVCSLLDRFKWWRSSDGVPTWFQISEVVSVA